MGCLFKTEEFAQQANCSTRTVYTFLRERVARDEIKVENKGRNGLLITVLRKGWELCKLFKFAFLAYFRDKGLIPYINTINTIPSGGGGNQPKDRIEKMCAKEGLNEGETRAVKNKISKISGIRSLGAVVKWAISQIKGGAMKSLVSSKDIEQREIMKERLQKQAQTDAKAILEAKGIFEQIPGLNATFEELDAFNAYHAMLSTYAANRLNELYQTHKEAF